MVYRQVGNELKSKILINAEQIVCDVDIGKRFDSPLNIDKYYTVVFCIEAIH